MMQCKDVNELYILAGMVTNQEKWGSLSGGPFPHDHIMYSLVPLFPPRCPHKVMVAKLKSLLKRGLIDGCACGCRGDWVITADGIAYLNHAMLKFVNHAMLGVIVGEKT